MYSVHHKERIQSGITPRTSSKNRLAKMSTSSDGIDWPSAASDSEVDTGPPIPPVPPSSAASSGTSSGAASLQLKLRTRPGSRSSGSGTDMASSDNDTSIDDVEWKEKYLALEAQLEKFRIQAAKIRVVLGERVSLQNNLVNKMRFMLDCIKFMNILTLILVRLTYKNIINTRLSFSPYILTVLGTEIVPLTPQ